MEPRVSPAVVEREWNGLKWRRVNELLSHAALAKATGVSEATIRNIENGKVREPHLGTLRKLCGYFNCKPLDLLEVGVPEETTAEGTTAEAA